MSVQAPRPDYLTPIFATIPRELKNTPQWVTWRGENIGGKWTKPPYQSSGAKARTNDPSTWVSFDKAVATFELDGWLDGVGIVLTQADPYVGVDLDHCREKGTGNIESWAREIIEKLDSYTEISPSGTGVRIIVRAKLPHGGRKKGHFEIYDRDRYLTITGHQIEGAH